MRAKRWTVWFAVSAILICWGGTSFGAEAFTVSGVSQSGGTGIVVGWTFEVTGASNIFLTHVGVYDHDGLGLANAHDAGVWQGSTLLTSLTVPAGTDAEYLNGYRYVALASPLELAPGVYSIGVLLSADNADERTITAAVEFDATGVVVPWSSATLPGQYSRKSTSSTLIRPGTGAGASVTNDQQGLTVNFLYELPVAGPTAVDDGALTQTNTPVTIDVLSNDSGSSLSITGFTSGAHGGVTQVEGKLVYTPAGNFVGDDSFTYTIADENGATATATVSITINTGALTIDIKPGSYPNTINLGSNGVIPVAILSSETFDAAALDPTTVFLEGSGVAIRGRGNKYMSHAEDVNGDGRVDLVVQFDTENLLPDEFQDGMATVTVDTGEYLLYLGEDEITIVPPGE